MTVLVSGATGFVGQRLCARFAADGVQVRAVTRRTECATPGSVLIPSIDADTDWSNALADVHGVVHLAARVHMMRDRSAAPLQAYRDLNTDGTANLAEQAAAAGVKRFLYLSTIKVNGEFTEGAPFRESDPPAPCDPYAVSKWEAEQRLRAIAQRTGLEVVIIRPPLVYGPGVKGNILRLLRWIELGVPLPFANVRNRRSLIGLDNLVDFIVRCLEHSRAAGETFLIADGHDLSTAELVQGLAAGMKKKCRMLPVSNKAVRRLLASAGKQALWNRLWGDLQIDASKAHALLDWKAPRGTSEGLMQVGAWYREWRVAGGAVA